MNMFGYTTEIGPRLTKAVIDVVHDLHIHGKKHVEITDHGRNVFAMPLSPPSKQVTEALQIIGDSVEWKITKDSSPIIIDACKEMIDAIPLPEVDKRTTAEERAKRAKMVSDSHAKLDAEKAEVDKLIEELRKANPWAIPDGKKSSHARAAANMRLHLGKAFPGIKFSVTTEAFAGGDSVTIAWDLGPTEDEVHKLIKPYKEGDFDGSQDMFVHNREPSSKAFRAVFGEIKYIHYDRKIPYDQYHIVRNALIVDSGLKYTHTPDHEIPFMGHTLARVIERAFSNVSLPVGSEVTGATLGHDGYRVTFKGPPIVEIPANTLMHQYCRLQDQHPDDVILLRIGDFYEAFGANADILRDELNSTITKRGNVAMAAFPHQVLDANIETLKAAGYTVTTGVLQPETPSLTENGKCHVEKHVHTKKQKDMWIVVFDERLERETFEAIRDACKLAGGWYSRQWGKTPGGFAFGTEEEAKAFASNY